MKNIKKLSLISIIFIALYTNKYNYICANSKDNNTDSQVYINQLEEKNKLFKEAIDNFGATSKEDAVRLYAEGIKQRSGPLQYSVMCDRLKIEFEKMMIKEGNYSWVTGVSSPWVSNYIINDFNKIGINTYLAEIEFILSDSKGITGKSFIELEVKKHNKYWCIININEK